jgi:hypothetical protein
MEGSILVASHSFGAHQLAYDQPAAAQTLDRLPEKSVRVTRYRGQDKRRIDYDISNSEHEPEYYSSTQEEAVSSQMTVEE